MKRGFIMIFIMLSALLAYACSTGPGEHDAFAQCLTEKGLTMYGTEWCHFCKAQKEEFGKSFRYVDYVDCDRSKEVCAVKGIEGYPTWILDGEKYSGVQPLPKLAQITGCALE